MVMTGTQQNGKFNKGNAWSQRIVCIMKKPDTVYYGAGL